MQLKVVCVSPTLAASGDGIGRAVADRLAFRVVDSEVIQRAAEKAGLDAHQVEEVERRRPLFHRLFASLRSRGLPADVKQKLEKALAEVMADPDTRKQLTQAGFEPVEGNGAAVSALINKELPLMRATAQRASITAE